MNARELVQRVAAPFWRVAAALDRVLSGFLGAKSIAPLKAYVLRSGPRYLVWTLLADVALAIVLAALAGAKGGQLVGFLLLVWFFRGFLWAKRAAFSAYSFASGGRRRLIGRLMADFESARFPAPKGSIAAPKVYLASVISNETLPANTRIRAAMMLESIRQVGGLTGYFQEQMAETAFREALKRFSARTGNS